MDSTADDERETSGTKRLGEKIGTELERKVCE